MKIYALCALIAPALLLAACDRPQAPADEALNAATPATAPAAPETPRAENAATPKPAISPPELTPDAERGVKGARNILLSFARAVEQKQYGQAWTLLSPADKQKWSMSEFAGLFADLGKITVAVPTGSMEGAAGSSYYTAPISISGKDSDGRPVRIEGEAVLRRVNDVEGATPAQLRWHFDRLTLDWTH